MAADFTQVIERVMTNEDSRWRTNPAAVTDNDGGTAKFGINSNSIPVKGNAVKTAANAAAVKALTADEAKGIYRSLFWRESYGSLSPALAYEVVDWQVNAGKFYPSAAMQTLVNAYYRRSLVGIDGTWGSETDSAVHAGWIDDNLLKAYRHARKCYYQNIATGSNAKYLSGWLNRIGGGTYMDYGLADEFNLLASQSLSSSQAARLRTSGTGGMTEWVPAAEPGEKSGGGFDWERYAPWIAGGSVAIIGLSAMLLLRSRRRRKRRRLPR